ncbi:hypothetical protein Scep_001488 [Stephania cephalantha]|uniref:Uncharacterized protein n=1 Tax=Stephania cephalantha TaxID=152367 RepID=A0AAP0Q3E5_9MAGN
MGLTMSPDISPGYATSSACLSMTARDNDTRFIVVRSNDLRPLPNLPEWFKKLDMHGLMHLACVKEFVYLTLKLQIAVVLYWFRIS